MWYIKHHGIKGQQWGVQNGPPYPLGTGDHNSSEKKAGWKSSLKGDSTSPKKRTSGNPVEETGKKEKFHLTDKQKKALIVGGVAAAGIALAAIGSYEAYKYSDIALTASKLATDKALKDVANETISYVKGSGAMGPNTAKTVAEIYLHNNKQAIKDRVKQQVKYESGELFKKAAKEEFSRQVESVKSSLKPGKVSNNADVLNELEKYAADYNLDMNALSNSEYLKELLKTKLK